ncbi:MAG TPA: hypothetical protein VN812_22165, partial [Candidatus Acidoferrales bacterium]|nr:hypothetical protein [Candidatus Acidoferrales bacterium]
GNSCQPNTHGCRAFFVINSTDARVTSTRSTVYKELGNLNRKAPQLVCALTGLAPGKAIHEHAERDSAPSE